MKYAGEDFVETNKPGHRCDVKKLTTTLKTKFETTIQFSKEEYHNVLGFSEFHCSRTSFSIT
jgi:hypothetical protein